MRGHISITEDRLKHIQSLVRGSGGVAGEIDRGIDVESGTILFPKPLNSFFEQVPFLRSPMDDWFEQDTNENILHFCAERLIDIYPQAILQDYQDKWMAINIARLLVDSDDRTRGLLQWSAVLDARLSNLTLSRLNDIAPYEEFRRAGLATVLVMHPETLYGVREESCGFSDFRTWIEILNWPSAMSLADANMPSGKVVWFAPAHFSWGFRPDRSQVMTARRNTYSDWVELHLAVYGLVKKTENPFSFLLEV